MSTFKDKLNKLTANVRKTFAKTVAKFRYDLWKEMTENEIAKSANPRMAANKWFSSYVKNKDNHHKGKLLRPGLMYMFKYDAKHKDTLEFWDRTPLDICIGVYRTKSGEPREVCINLHMLPERTRLLVVYQIYYMFRSKYKENLFVKDQKPIAVRWKDIAKPLERYGIGFAVRQYIPSRRSQTVEIAQEDWKFGVYVNPRTYEGINARRLEQKWKEYVQRTRRGQSGDKFK